MAEMIRGKPVYEPSPKPDYDPRTHKPPRQVLTVEADRVVRTWALDARAATADDVRAEAQRRIVAITGAGDLTGCMIKQLNANMRANELNNKLATGGTLDAGEQAEAAALQALANAVKAIRAKSNILEVSDPIPGDYTDDNWW